MFCGIEIRKPSYILGHAIREQYIIHYILNVKGSYQVDNKIYVSFICYMSSIFSINIVSSDIS